MEDSNNKKRLLDDDEDEIFSVDISSYDIVFQQCQFIKQYDTSIATKQQHQQSPQPPPPFFPNSNNNNAIITAGTTVLATKRFVIFRLVCSSSSTSSKECAGSSSSSSNDDDDSGGGRYRDVVDYDDNDGYYGEYMIDLETYLKITVNHFQQRQRKKCQICEKQEQCDNSNNQKQQQQEQDAPEDEEEDDDSDRWDWGYYDIIDCESCIDECMKIEHMEENGYIDATTFLDCQMIYDDSIETDDQEGYSLYAGPICSVDSSKISIGVFIDEDCQYLDPSKDIDDYLLDENGYKMKVSYSLLMKTYTNTKNTGTSISSCMEPPYKEEEKEKKKNEYEEKDESSKLWHHDGDEHDEDIVLDICEKLYNSAGKCENPHGLYLSQQGTIITRGKSEEEEEGKSLFYYAHQNDQENIVCDYIETLKNGTYNEKGEIVIIADPVVVVTDMSLNIMTYGQKLILTVLIIGTIYLSGYAIFLRSRLLRMMMVGRNADDNDDPSNLYWGTSMSKSSSSSSSSRYYHRVELMNYVRAHDNDENEKGVGDFDLSLKEDNNKDDEANFN